MYWATGLMLHLAQNSFWLKPCSTMVLKRKSLLFLKHGKKRVDQNEPCSPRGSKPLKKISSLNLCAMIVIKQATKAIGFTLYNNLFLFYCYWSDSE